MLAVEIGDVIVHPDEIYDVDVGGMFHTMTETNDGNLGATGASAKINLGLR